MVAIDKFNERCRQADGYTQIQKQKRLPVTRLFIYICCNKICGILKMFPEHKIF